MAYKGMWRVGEYYSQNDIVEGDDNTWFEARSSHTSTLQSMPVGGGMALDATEVGQVRDIIEDMLVTGAVHGGVRLERDGDQIILTVTRTLDVSDISEALGQLLTGQPENQYYLIYNKDTPDVVAS